MAFEENRTSFEPILRATAALALQIDQRKVVSPGSAIGPFVIGNLLLFFGLLDRLQSVVREQRRGVIDQPQKLRRR